MTTDTGRWLFVALAVLGLALVVPAVGAGGNAADASPEDATTDWVAWVEAHVAQHAGPGAVEWMRSHVGAHADDAHHGPDDAHHGPDDAHLHGPDGDHHGSGGNHWHGPDDAHHGADRPRHDGAPHGRGPGC